MEFWNSRLIFVKYECIIFDDFQPSADTRAVAGRYWYGDVCSDANSIQQGPLQLWPASGAYCCYPCEAGVPDKSSREEES